LQGSSPETYQARNKAAAPAPRNPHICEHAPRGANQNVSQQGEPVFSASYRVSQTEMLRLADERAEKRKPKIVLFGRQRRSEVPQTADAADKQKQS